jgi:hypothetical protein
MFYAPVEKSHTTKRVVAKNLGGESTFFYDLSVAKKFFFGYLPEYSVTDS